MTKAIKPEKQLKRTAVTIAIIEAAIIIVAAIMLITVNKYIRCNNDILNEYDTYVIGRKISNSFDSDTWIDDSGKIHKDEHYAYIYEYDYNGKMYTLTEPYKPDVYDLVHANSYQEEPIKIKSDNPEQAVLASKYNNYDEKFVRFAVIFFAVGLQLPLLPYMQLSQRHKKRNKGVI